MSKIANITISTDDNSAIITHYLQNINTKYVLPFEKDAWALLYGNAKKEKKHTLENEVLQYNMFPELFSVPFKRLGVNVSLT